MNTDLFNTELKDYLAVSGKENTKELREIFLAGMVSALMLGKQLHSEDKPTFIEAMGRLQVVLTLQSDVLSSAEKVLVMAGFEKNMAEYKAALRQNAETDVTSSSSSFEA